MQAEAGGADYVVLGPLYDTPSKHMYGPPLGLSHIEEAARAVRVPIIGIGGVTAVARTRLAPAGAFGVAVITAILGADDVEAATRARSTPWPRFDDRPCGHARGICRLVDRENNEC